MKNRFHPAALDLVARNLIEPVGCCTISECAAPAVALGLCWKHYARQRRHGDAGLTRRRYMLPPECRHCGTNEPGAFYASCKSICKICRKIRSIQKVSP